MREIILLTMLLWSCVSVASEISGLIRQVDGKPIAGAIVQISTARLRTGSSPMCPSCWLDCKKSAKTDGAGTFRIPDVSDTLVFRLLVLAEGFAPCYIADVDPAAGSAGATLNKRDLSSFPDSQTIKGKITGDGGRPVAGATIAPVFSQDGLDSVALTNLHGEFVLTSLTKVRKNLLDIHAEGYRQVKVNASLSDGVPKPVNVNLGRGVLVTGRVLQNGKPIQGVTMGACHLDRSTKSLDSIEAVTGENGAFQIWCVPPKDKVAVYSTMESFAGKGATSLRVIDTGADESTYDVGDIEVVKAGKLTGRLHLPEGKTFPPETRINLDREKARDAVVIDVSSDGHFEAQDIPLGEGFTISLPDDYAAQTVSGGFAVDEYNNSLSGSLTTDSSALKVDLVWKDPKEQEKERFEAFVRKQFGDFFESAKLTQEQVAVFISVKRDGRKVWEEACKQDEIPPGILFEEFEARELTKRLGEKYNSLFLQHQNLKWGRETLNRFIRAHEGEWLNDEEKKRLTPLVAAETEKIGRHWREHYWTKASLQEKIEVTKGMYDGVYAACVSDLPPSKLKILRECLDICQRQELEEIRKKEKDQ